MSDQPELRERIARAMCAEKNAVYGEPPCWEVEGPWPNPNCGDCTCHDLADAVLSALSPQPPVTPEPVCIHMTAEMAANCRTCNPLAGAAHGQQVTPEQVYTAADRLGYHCIGCGHLCGDPEKDLAMIRKAGGQSCCPERKMEPLSAALRALAGGGHE